MPRQTAEKVSDRREKRNLRLGHVRLAHSLRRKTTLFAPLSRFLRSLNSLPRSFSAVCRPHLFPICLLRPHLFKLLRPHLLRDIKEGDIEQLEKAIDTLLENLKNSGYGH